MPLKHACTFGLVLGAFLLLCDMRSDASGGLFSRHHGDCDANASTVRLPAQHIRIETSRPRVVVQESSAFRSHHRAFVPMVGLMQAQPIVASFLVAPQESRGFSTSNALQAAHNLELQALEVARVRAAQEAEAAAMNLVHQRIMANFSKPGQVTSPAASTAELTQIKTEIEKLAKRIDHIEQLLIIHDEELKKQKDQKKVESK